MVRVFVFMTALAAALPALLFPASPVRAADGGSEEVYIVRVGDTLSSIAEKRLGDVSRWRDILEANPQVTDPDLIYPGDSLLLPGTGEPEAIAISTGREAEIPADPYPPLPVEPAAPAEWEEAAVREPSEPLLPVERVRPLPVVSSSVYRSSGYIAESLPEASIISSVRSRISLVEGDEVFISIPADEGRIYTVVRPTREVFHPQSGEFLGWVIRVIGWAEVNCPGETASRAVLTSTVDAVYVGDLLVPFDPEDILEENILGRKQTTFCLKRGDNGYLLATQEDRTAIGEGDIVFIDQGRAQGVKPGSQFVVYRHLEPVGVDVVGQLQILRVGERTSTALVINSIIELSVADFIQPWEPPATAGSAYGG